MAMNVDFRDFDKGMKTLVEKSVPARVSQGIFRAGNELLRDAIYEKPFAPFDEGALRASARTQFPNGISVDFGKGVPGTTVDAKDLDGFSLLVGFNIIYAARWHELTPAEDARINWTLPGSGRKYLEIKLVRHKDKYIKIVALYLEKFLRPGGRP